MPARKHISAPDPHEIEELSEQKMAALAYIQEAWEEARHDGLDGDVIAHAALFAAFTELISTYGEEAVVQLAKSLPRRIQHGDYTLNRTQQ